MLPNNRIEEIRDRLPRFILTYSISYVRFGKLLSSLASGKKYLSSRIVSQGYQ